MLNRIVFALALTAPLAAACTDSSVNDELDTDDATAGDASKADEAGTYTYYQVSPDLRACDAPGCGGVFYRLANATSTRCLDGGKAEQCYAATVDWAKLGLGDAALAKVQSAVAHQLLVRATVVRDIAPNDAPIARLVPSEAWLAQGPNAAEGRLVKVEDSGVRCIAFPCPSNRELKLNSSLTASIAELGWDSSGATREQIGRAIEQMHTTGLIVAGDRYTVSGGPGGEGKARSVTQFWLRATDDASPKTCVVTGCSGQICADRPMASTCELLPEYACYHDPSATSCEVQADGECGWTQTPELAACLADARN
jgi:hypothetical protein